MKREFTEIIDNETIIRATAKLESIGNQSPYFSITARIRKNGVYSSGGCIHDEVKKYFPELVPYIKWHLTSMEEPMHYIANTVYHASDRDHKARDYEAARNSAVWPEATDEQLSLPKEELAALLQARLPKLMEDFRKDMSELFGQTIA